MIDTINNLKNNRMKTGITASAITSEHTVRMKRTLGSLNTRTIKGTEPLRIGLQDLQNTSKRGKGWLVGASWKGNDSTPSQASQQQEAPTDAASDSDGSSLIPGTTTSASLDTLARENGMNTTIRRAIFTTLLSATDYRDAHARLLKLRLKRAQEPEIPLVLLRCAAAEHTYNPYYTLIARRLCATHKMRMAFQFALWDLVKRMAGEDDEAEEEGPADPEGDLDMRRVVNLAKTFGFLVTEGAVPVTCLKTVEFPYLAPKLHAFVEVLLVTVVLETQKKVKDDEDDGGKVLREVFVSVQKVPALARGLQYFLQKVVRKGEIVSGKRERRLLKKGCDAASEFLAGIGTAAAEGGVV